MKKNILIALAVIFIAALSSFVTYSFEANKTTAEVNQAQGLSIFTNCKPVLPYKVLGSEKTTIAMKGNPEELLNIALKKKKDFPDANGIIFTSVDMDRYDFIKFE